MKYNAKMVEFHSTSSLFYAHQPARCTGKSLHVNLSPIVQFCPIEICMWSTQETSRPLLRAWPVNLGCVCHSPKSEEVPVVETAIAMSSYLTKDKKDKVERFKNTTNASEKTARSYLEMFKWDLMRAVDDFYANGGENIDEDENDASVSTEMIEAWFDQYADADDEEDQINEDGILKFCEDVGIDPQDIGVLAIAWKMEAAYMCAFTRKEWTRGMKALGCDSAEKLKAEIPNLPKLIESDGDFKKFYSFCFGFSKEPGQKSLGIDIAQPMWELLLSKRFPTLTADWLTFLTEKTPCKGVTRDTWDLLLEFFFKVRESYDDYDENEAWPVLIDDYMSWIETKGKK